MLRPPGSTKRSTTETQMNRETNRMYVYKHIYVYYFYITSTYSIITYTKYDESKSNRYHAMYVYTKSAHCTMISYHHMPNVSPRVCSKHILCWKANFGCVILHSSWQICTVKQFHWSAFGGYQLRVVGRSLLKIQSKKLGNLPQLQVTIPKSFAINSGATFHPRHQKLHLMTRS